MRTTTYLVAVLLLLSVSLIACQKEKTDENTPPIDETTVLVQAEPLSISEDSALVLERDLALLIEAPRHQTEDARSHLQTGRYQPAAKALFALAERLNQMATHATDKAKVGLEASAQEMIHLSKRAKIGKPIITDQELDQALARANLALAEYHLDQARTVWAEKRTNTTALQLNAASVFLEQTSVNGELEEDLVEVLDRTVEHTESLARKLAEKAGYTTDEVDAQINELGLVIWRMRGYLKSPDAVQ